jgi:hypothetical protein
MPKRVLIETRDLFFRGKLQGLVQASGAEVTPDEPCDIAVIELGKTGTETRIREFVRKGIPVLAFGSHVNAEALRTAREWGARAVPNSEVEKALRALLR